VKEIYRRVEAVARRSIEELSKGVVGAGRGGEATEEMNETAAKGDPARAEPEAMKGKQGELFPPGEVPGSNEVEVGLNSREIQVMERILVFPDETIDERRHSLRIGRSQEWRARRKLVLEGVLKLEGKIGKWEFFGPTDVGREWALSRDIERKKFKSGLLHEILLERVESGIREQVPEAVSRRWGQIEGVQYDLLMNEYGMEEFKIPIQVSVANKVQYEVDRIRQLLRHPCVGRVVVVGVSRKKALALRMEIRKKEVQGNGKDVAVMAGEDVLSKKVNWQALIKGAVKASHEGHVWCSDYGGGEKESKA